MNLTYVPEPLSIIGFPNFSFFPKQLVFIRDNQFATYTPTCFTFDETDNIFAMSYTNTFDPLGRIIIGFHTKKLMWAGVKFYAREEVRCVRGTEWRDFFTRFTSVGCDEREGRAKFISIYHSRKNSNKHSPVYNKNLMV